MHSSLSTFLFNSVSDHGCKLADESQKMLYLCHVHLNSHYIIQTSAIITSPTETFFQVIQINPVLPPTKNKTLFGSTAHMD